MKSKGKMSNLRDHAPDNGKPAANTSQTTEPPWSISSTEVGAATNGVPTSDADGNTHYPPNLPTHIYRSQDFQPVGMTPPSINAFTNPLFTEQPPEANGLLSTSHLYAHQAPNNSFQQQQSRPPVLSMDTEELMNRAAYEVQQQLYQLQNINQSPQPSHWQDQYDQNHNASHLVSYDSPTLHNPYAAQAATQSLQNAFAQGQMTQQSSVMARHQSPTSLSQQEPIDDYRQHVHTINYHQHQSYSQFQQTLASQTEEVPSRKRLRSDSQDQSSSELHSLLAKEQNGKKPSKKRPRRESRGQLEGQSKQSEEEPSQKRSRGGSQSQRKSQSQEQEQPERVSLAVPPQLPQQTTSGPAPIPGETVVDADPATPVSQPVPLLNHSPQDQMPSFESILMVSW